MTDDTGAGQPQGGEAAQPQGGQPPAQGAAAPPTQAQGAGEAKGGSDRAALEAKVEQLQTENYQYREQRRQWEAEQQAAKPLADQLKEAKAQLEAAQTQQQEQSLQLATVQVAQKLGYRNPELAYRLLDSKDVQFDADGKPTNVEKLLTGLAKSDPYLLTATDFGGGSRGTQPGGSGQNMNDLIRSGAGR